MTIDMREVRDDVIGHLADGAGYIRDLPPQDYLLAVGIGLTGIGLVMAANYWFQKWRKQRGYRMILRERRDILNRLEADILTNGLLEAELAGTISRKEHDEELQRLSDRFGLPDLIPPKRRARIVKNEIKARLNKSEKKKPPANPITGKPQPLRDRIGTFAHQFWRSKGA